MKIFRNLPRADYIAIMKIAGVIVGNSSSGIIEAPLFKLPTVNIGRRQRDRDQSTNVINAPNKAEAIYQAINRALSGEFKEVCQKAVSIYGDGHASEKIVKILKDLTIDEKLLNKRSIFN